MAGRSRAILDGANLPSHRQEKQPRRITARPSRLSRDGRHFRRRSNLRSVPKSRSNEPCTVSVASVRGRYLHSGPLLCRPPRPRTKPRAVVRRMAGVCLPITRPVGHSLQPLFQVDATSLRASRIPIDRPPPGRPYGLQAETGDGSHAESKVFWFSSARRGHQPCLEPKAGVY